MESIKKLRRSKGWTQERLALESDISQSMLSSIEAGKREPSLDTLRRLAGSLGVDTATLLEREDGKLLSFRDLLEILSEKARQCCNDPEKLKRIEAVIYLAQSELSEITDSPQDDTGENRIKK